MESITAPELVELEEYSRFDPPGTAERIEWAIAVLTSVVSGKFGTAIPPERIATDWGGLRARAEESREVDYEELARERERQSLGA